MTQQKRMKKGITLIEIILAIVLIAIILGIAIPKLMSTQNQGEIKQTIVSDVKSIVEAASLWRKSAAAADGVYTDISPTAIRSRLPQSMQVDAAQGLIFSSGLATGQNNATTAAMRNTGVVYTVWFNLTNDAANPADTMSFAIAIDTTFGGDELGWDLRMQEYALDAFQDTLTDLAQRGEITEFTASSQNAQGASGVAFNCADTGVAVRCFENILVQ